MSICFSHVSFSYKQEKGEPVLRDINLTIRPGETIGIIGGTGSAKSSLVNLISRLYDATEGQVMVGGRDVREYDLDTLRNEVAVVLAEKCTVFRNDPGESSLGKKMRRKKSVCMPVNWPVPMNLSGVSRRGTIRISSRAERMCREEETETLHCPCSSS